MGAVRVQQVCRRTTCRVCSRTDTPPAPGSRRITELALLVEMYQERGTKVEFVDEAVWIANTTLTFYVDDDAENADHGSRCAACACVRACVFGFSTSVWPHSMIV